MIKRQLLFNALTLSLLVTVTNSQATDLTAKEPHAIVEHLHMGLLESMRQYGQESLRTRFTHLKPTITTLFDFDTISRIVCGRSWLEMDGTTKDEFIQAFRKLSIATYAHNFSSYDGESFKVTEVKIESSRAIVKTELLRSSGRNISLTYMLRKNSDQWKIINVISEGVSDLSLKRSEYGTIIKSRGIKALINNLKEQLAKYPLKTS